MWYIIYIIVAVIFSVLVLIFWMSVLAEAIHDVETLRRAERIRLIRENK
jgi:predicted tellurium resistance membrane protein TerC